LQRNGPVSKQSPLWSETPTASESSQSDGPAFPSSKMFATPQAHDSGKGNPDRVGRFGAMHGGRNLADEILHPAFQSSPVGSLANLIPLQESVKRLLTIVTSGQRLPVSFARFARDGSSGRMFAVSSTPSLDGSSAAFSGTWPTWGIASDGACGELPTLERCTSANESSSWPTPHGFSQDGRSNGPSGNELGRAVNRSWPTPTTRDYKDGSAAACANVPANGLLGRVVHQWPTPKGSHRSGRRADDRPEASGRGRERRSRGMPGSVEPDVGRVAHGVPARVDRLRALGNAVVPQQAYPLFAEIARIERLSPSRCMSAHPYKTERILQNDGSV
jgi:hypothetical protein